MDTDKENDIRQALGRFHSLPFTEIDRNSSACELKVMGS
jgi:hypothetical protein